MRVNGSVAVFVMSAWAIAAWITHVVTCLTVGSWGFLVAGALVAPIGVIHGTGIWFGVL